MPRLEHIQKSFKSIFKKINAFFHRIQWKQALIFSYFILLSLGFWILQSLQQEYEVTLSIPIKYKNIPANITFTDSVPDKIAVRVKDKGSVLMNYSFGRKFVPIEASIKNLQESNGYLSVPDNVIATDILKQLIATTTIVNITPAHINIPYSERAHKEIAVVFDGKIDMEPGFQVYEDIQIEPSFINVYGSDAHLDSLSEIKTVYTELKKINQTVSRTIQLQKLPNISYDPEIVTVTIPVEEYTEKTLEIAVECTGIPNEYTVRIFPATIKVVCNIPLSRFKDLSEEQFSIQVPFSELEENISGSIPIELNLKPEWVRSVTLVPDRIEFILEQSRTND